MDKYTDKQRIEFLEKRIDLVILAAQLENKIMREQELTINNLQLRIEDLERKLERIHRDAGMN